MYRYKLCNNAINTKINLHSYHIKTAYVYVKVYHILRMAVKDVVWSQHRYYRQ